LWGRIAVVLLAVAAAVAVYLLFFSSPEAGGAGPAPRRAVAQIGEGPDAVAVSAAGAVLGPAPDSAALPAISLSAAPKSGRLAGPALEQVRVLGAAPAPLRACVQSSRYGESGVDVELRSGIELRFGTASRARRKWRSAATVLADPSIASLDYVDLHAPRRPAVYGSGHSLPPPDTGAGPGCGS
jgi:hypothetical protein